MIGQKLYDDWCAGDTLAGLAWRDLMEETGGSTERALALCRGKAYGEGLWAIHDAMRALVETAYTGQRSGATYRSLMQRCGLFRTTDGMLRLFKDFFHGRHWRWEGEDDDHRKFRLANRKLFPEVVWGSPRVVPENELCPRQSYLVRHGHRFVRADVFPQYGIHFDPHTGRDLWQVWLTWDIGCPSTTIGGLDPKWQISPLE
jgi:hypothetical protein